MSNDVEATLNLDLVLTIVLSLASFLDRSSSLLDDDIAI